MSFSFAGKQTVLMDLDGTLLPMDMDTFVNTYFKLLAVKAAPYGYDPKTLVAAVWKGTKAMVKNDGTKKNTQRFWEVFSQELGEEVLQLQDAFEEFYGKEFHGAKAATGENPLARKLVDTLKAKGFDLVLATNPLFPKVGVATRLSWIGLTPEDFSYVTTYENSTLCKPNPLYYREILEKIGKRGEDCVMIGNDVQEDLPAKEAGMEVYLTTDCLLNPENRDLSQIPHGTFRELLTLAEEI